MFVYWVNILCAYLDICEFQHNFPQVACYYVNKSRSNLLNTWCHRLMIVAICVVLVLWLRCVQCLDYHCTLLQECLQEIFCNSMLSLIQHFHWNSNGKQGILINQSITQSINHNGIIIYNGLSSPIMCEMSSII